MNEFKERFDKNFFNFVKKSVLEVQNENGTVDINKQGLANDEIKKQLEMGANPNAEQDGKSVLCLATENNCAIIVNQLCKAGANPNYSNGLPVMLAIPKGNTFMISKLISSGAKITPEMITEAQKHSNAVESSLRIDGSVPKIYTEICRELGKKTFYNPYMIILNKLINAQKSTKQCPSPLEHQK